MPDASDPRGRGPTGWGDAFAAMPQETPPADAWPRVAARLDARCATAASSPLAGNRHRASRRPVRAAGWIGAAAAAAIALVVAWPRHGIAPPAAAPPPTATAASGTTPAQRHVAAATTPAPKPAPPAVRTATVPTAPAIAASARKSVGDPTAVALPKVVEAARKPRYAKATPVGTHRLDTLYAESARLEALLGLARDDRVSSAAAALLSAELDAQVAGIDVRLAQPGLDDAQRTALWQARVDALRQAAGFESTQRVLASQGDGGALLVSVD